MDHQAHGLHDPKQQDRYRAAGWTRLPFDWQIATATEGISTACLVCWPCRAKGRGSMGVLKRLQQATLLAPTHGDRTHS